jgi:hypothetical protein
MWIHKTMAYIRGSLQSVTDEDKDQLEVHILCKLAENLFATCDPPHSVPYSLEPS